MPNVFLRFFCAFFGVSISFFCVANAEITFSGDQDGFIEEGEYLATSTITVRAGKSLIFAPGCIVRFKQYAGIVVEGALRCNGTSAKPIVFTSENYRPNSSWKIKSPAPFDWNGVTVPDSNGSVVFENVRIAYGAIGLDIKSSISRARLEQTVFTEIGRDAFTCAGKTIEVKDDQPFSFQQPQPVAPEIVMKTRVDTVVIQKKEAPVASVVHEKMSGKAFFRWGLGLVGVASLGFSGYSYYMQGKQFKNQADDIHDPNKQTLVNDNYQKSNAEVDKANIGWACFGAMAGAFVLTFCF